MKDSSPLVSVVTPFYNTGRYLEECIESVLAQTFPNYEYLLVDNCSTDNSAEIAARYARRDPRVRVVRQERFLSQVQNYNRALQHISPLSTYCKVVQADDWLFPECLARMVAVAESSPEIGLVGAYSLSGVEVRGNGLPVTSRVFSGREICRRQLLESRFFFGSPTSVMYRSDLVRSRTPFYAEGRLHEDTELCYELLATLDFGFVHQVLTYCRWHDESITSSVRNFSPDVLDKYIVVKRYGPVYLTPEEQQRTLRDITRQYYRFLGEAVLHRTDQRFWAYHKEGLSTIGERLDRVRLGRYAALAVAGRALHPWNTTAAVLRRLRSRVPSRTAS